MARSIRTSASSVFAAALLFAAMPASAQDRAGAEELFQLGKGAMTRQDYGKACSYFQASLNADYALGTLLNLAICHETAGKLASAWSEYRVLEDKARRATPPQNDRANFAHDHAEALRPRLSRLHIVLGAEDKAMNGFVVKIDGAVAQPELFDVGVPVDVGSRTITAWAPDHEAWTQTINIADERLKLDVTVPALKSSPKAPPPPPPKPDPSILAALQKREEAKSQRTLGFVIGGIGLGVAAAGGVFGILALGAKKDTACGNGCIKGSTDLSNAHDAFTRANTFGWVSNIALGAGALGAGIGAYLVFSADSGDGDAPGADIRAGLTPGGVTLGGAF